MQILLLTQSYLPVLGGLQQVVHDLARGLITRRDAVTVVTQRHPRTLPAAEIIEQVPVQRYFFMSPELRMLRHGRGDLFAFAFWALPRTYVGLNQLVKRFQPEVIHYHYPQHLSRFVLALCQGHHVPLIVSFHGAEVQEAQRGTEADRALLHAILNTASTITAVSRDALNTVIEFHPASQPKSYVIYNGLRPEAFDHPSLFFRHARRYILGAGRLVEEKGFHLLIRAFAQTLSENPGLELDLILAGDGKYRSTLERLAHQLGVQNRVVFKGNLARPDLAALIYGAHFAVIPSLAETFGLFALEAMALNRRIIATNVGGLPELIGSDRSGTEVVNQLVPVSVDGISQAMNTWLRDPKFVPDALSNRARALNFSTDRMIDAYRDIYERTLYS